MMWKLANKRLVGPSATSVDASLEGIPSLAWYPGSGFDLTPLALDTPRAEEIFGDRLYPVDPHGSVLAVSDINDEFRRAVTGSGRVRPEYPYEDLHRVLGQSVRIDEGGGVLATLQCGFGQFPAAFFFATAVSPDVDHPEYRHSEQDKYLVAAICGDTLALWKAFQEAQIRISRLVVVRSGGFTGNETNVNTVVAEMLELGQNHPCRPKFLITDNSVSFEHLRQCRMTGHHLARYGYGGVALYQLLPERD